MFRLTRPVFQQVLKSTTGITGIPVHPTPIPALIQTYQATLTRLQTLPQSSVYRQGAEAITQRKLNIVQAANGDILKAEKELEDGQIEEAIMVAEDELKLANNMAEWKSWEPLEEKPQPGQWEYFGRTSEYK